MLILLLLIFTTENNRVFKISIMPEITRMYY